VAKRSPILGYNHNVRYRGLVFHVQTEDSGVLSPHLFTHLFHEGVIVSTRKLVYDSGASEDAIKALMQAQHKAVMKDLRGHAFDDKIDQYLSGVEGLLPRESEGGEPAAPKAVAEKARAKRKSAAPPAQEAPKEAPPPPVEVAPPVQPPAAEPPKPRTQTVDRAAKGSQFRSVPPPASVVDDAPTLLNPDMSGIPSAISAQGGATVPTPSPFVSHRPTPPRVSPPSMVVKGSASRPSQPMPAEFRIDSSPEIEILDEESSHHRGPRDTAVNEVFVDDAPGHRAHSDSVAPLPPAPPRHPPTRPPSHNANALPAVRPPSRPAITPPRPVNDDARARGDSGAVEVYAPPPASAEPPPGERSERPGQYSMNRRAKEGAAAPMRDDTGRIAIPSGLSRPSRPQAQPGRPPPPPAAPAVPQQARGEQGSGRHPSSSDGVPQVESRPPQMTAPISSRTSPAQPHGGVVASRPAVIVGAPAKSTPTVQRVRKAREDEGRGFGQGLISEKSLDEVILAYLSEDGDDK
jgi:hypothetical protein